MFLSRSFSAIGIKSLKGMCRILFFSCLSSVMTIWHVRHSSCRIYYVEPVELSFSLVWPAIISTLPLYSLRSLCWPDWTGTSVHVFPIHHSMTKFERERADRCTLLSVSPSKAGRTNPWSVLEREYLLRTTSADCNATFCHLFMMLPMKSHANQRRS